MTWMHILFLSVNNFIDIGMYYDKSQFWPDVLEYIVVFFSYKSLSIDEAFWHEEHFLIFVNHVPVCENPLLHTSIFLPGFLSLFNKHYPRFVCVCVAMIWFQ